MRLRDPKYKVEAVVDVRRGNRVTALLYGGRNVLHSPGIPFMAPWANRVPAGFEIDGQFYALDPALGNLRLDKQTGLPIHGLLMNSDAWEVVQQDEHSVMSRLQFWRWPELMAQWPFAHEYELTWRLRGGALEGDVIVRNLAAVRMPVSIGFHPYFTLPGTSRASWQITVPAKWRVVHDDQLLPTGELVPAAYDGHFDSGYTGFPPSPRFEITAGKKSVVIQFSDDWPVTIVWRPEGKNFVCIEPMATVTNGINLHAAGLWNSLPWIEPNASWSAGFAVCTRGYCDTEWQ